MPFPSGRCRFPFEEASRPVFWLANGRAQGDLSFPRARCLASDGGQRLGLAFDALKSHSPLKLSPSPPTRLLQENQLPIFAYRSARGPAPGQSLHSGTYSTHVSEDFTSFLFPLLSGGTFILGLSTILSLTLAGRSHSQRNPDDSCE